MSQAGEQIDKLCVNAIRMLAVDMVEAANSGHPGMPLGVAPMAHVLFSRFLRFNPADPAWPGRDRFILSAGHGSALLYALLHLNGYDLPLEQLRNFRQWGSITAGHPEYGLCPGVEATTGPLGQGFAMGVGMAMAQRFLAGRFNRPDLPVVDHHIYAIVSDGDLMEGVTSEAASLAGTLGLGRLIYLYDDNRISIEGGTELAFTEDVAARFAAYNWQVLEVADGNDLAAMAQAIEQARAETARPSLIKIRTHIGFGCPKQDQASCHGEPLGAEAMAATRQTLGWPHEPFAIPAEVTEHMGASRQRGAELQNQWQELMDRYAQAHPQEAAQLKDWQAGKLPSGWEKSLPAFAPGDGPLATRAASGKVLNALASSLPNLVGGSADLAPSNKTMLAGAGDMRGRGDQCGPNVHFGVREHAMGAAVNGMALHGGVLPYGGTFLVFADYMRPSLRLAALMQTKSIFIFTHDSIAVGEDGPTHQPVEQIMSLRAMPGFTVLRPADANETALAWQAALSRSGPSALMLSRQKLPILDPAVYPVAQAFKGAYVLAEASAAPRMIIMATGAEVHLALAARQSLEDQGTPCRVVSMPSWEIFAEQGKAYMDQVLPPSVSARLAIEAGCTLGWERWVGSAGAVVGLDRFGASAPGGTVLAKLGFNVDNVVAQAKKLLG